MSKRYPLRVFFESPKEWLHGEPCLEECAPEDEQLAAGADQRAPLGKLHMRNLLGWLRLGCLKIDLIILT